jgi:outer membrane protein
MGAKTRLIASLAVAAMLPAGASAAEKTETLSLTYHSAIARALAKNFQIKVEAYNPRIAAARTLSEKGAFDPVAGLTITYDENRSDLRSLTPTTDDGLLDSSDAGDFASASGVEGQATISGLTPWGLNYSLGPSITRNTDSQAPYDERYETFVGGSITQPILQGFGTDVNLAPLRIARANQEISTWEYRQRVIDVVTDTIGIYNDLYFAIENLAVERRSLALAKQTLHDNQRRAEIGVMSPLDVVQAQADVADRDGRVLVAERAVADTRNFLKQLVTDDVDHILSRGVEIVPPPINLKATINEKADLKRAIELRPDYGQALLNIQKQNITVVVNRNQALPQLDLTASLGLNGTDTSAGGSVSQLKVPSNIAATVGAVFSQPIFNRTAKGNLRAADLEVARQLVALKQLEQTIYIEVDNAAGLVATTRKLIDSSRAARIFAQRTLEAAQSRLTSGTATTFEVLQFQRDLATAEINEVRALTAFDKALVAYDRVTGTTLERHRIQIE